MQTYQELELLYCSTRSFQLGNKQFRHNIGHNEDSQQQRGTKYPNPMLPLTKMYLVYLFRAREEEERTRREEEAKRKRIAVGY